MRKLYSVGFVLIAASLGLSAHSAMAANAVQKECSTKYQAAKAANQLNGLSWNQYYKQCAATAKGETPAAPAKPAPTPAAVAPAPAAPAPAPTTAKATKTNAAPPAAAGAAVFPTAIAPQFAKDSPGKARRETCLAQYRANKATNGNGGLKWIEKGGGYYHECNNRLKG